jgi:hypothetical protein
MATKLTDEKKTAFEIADMLDNAADAIRVRSKKAYAEGKMTLEEYQDARTSELELRSEITLIVAKNLSQTLQSAADAGANIEAAIADATEKIAEVRALKKALDVCVGLIALASAISSGNVPAIVGATKAVVDLTQKPKPA